MLGANLGISTTRPLQPEEFKVLFESMNMQADLEALMKDGESKSGQYITSVYNLLEAEENSAFMAVPMDTILRHLEVDDVTATVLLEFVDNNHDGLFTFQEFRAFVYVLNIYEEMKSAFEDKLADRVERSVAHFGHKLFSDLQHETHFRSARALRNHRDKTNVKVVDANKEQDEEEEEDAKTDSAIAPNSLEISIADEENKASDIPSVSGEDLPNDKPVIELQLVASDRGAVDSI